MNCINRLIQIFYFTVRFANEKKIVTVLLLIFATKFTLFAQDEYESPYTIDLTYPVEELIPDIINDSRGGINDISEVPYSEWYSEGMKHSNGSWGPNTRQLEYPEINSGKNSDWIRERIIAIAQRLIGYGYQHHHIPDWDPPADFPWKETCMGKNGKGVDCSNFTSYVYNLALGIKLDGDVVKQSTRTDITKIGNSHFKKAAIIEKPSNYNELALTFQTGDLIFIKSDRGEISHVVIWLGGTAKSPDGTPLILDSHGAEVKDSNGNLIPCGIHIRPLRKDSWYWQDMAFAHRIVE